MTVEKILEAFDAFKENNFSDQVKIAWLCDVEGRVLCEIQKMSPDSVTLPKGSDDILAVPESYSRVYLLYLAAMAELSRGHNDAYAVLFREFEAALSVYAKYYIRTRG